MFVGEYNHQIDDKGRIRIPTKFKAELGADPFIMQGVAKCLYVYEKSYSDDMFKKIFGDGNFEDGQNNAKKAKLMRKACYAEEDKQGRVSIPISLLRYANIGVSSSIVSVGAYDHVQIWAKDEWDKFCAEEEGREQE